MTHPLSARALRALCSIALCFSLSACADDDSPAGETTPGLSCPAGQTRNPITGQCSGGALDQPVDQPDTPPPVDQPVDQPDMRPDLPPVDQPTDQPTDQPDMRPPGEACDGALDSDGDGLTNACECLLGTDPYLADTDGDGLTDGQEDANGDCRFSPGESSAREADTDGDGINDGDEVMAGLNPLSRDSDGDGIEDRVEYGHACLNPLDPDTDADGIPDGIEDSDQDGLLGSCANRAFDATCAMGESDPCEADTDGDGTPDGDEVQYRQCRPEDTQNLTQPLLITSAPGDYQLAADPRLSQAVVTSAQVANLQAHAFDATPDHMVGFIAALSPPSGTTSAATLAAHVFTQVGQIPSYASAQRRSAGRQITTHDSHEAVVGGVIALPAGVAPEVARELVLRQLSGAPDATHALTGTVAPDPASETLMLYQVVARSATQYVVVAAFTPLNRYDDKALDTGWLADDLVGGTSLANATELLEADCVSYDIVTRPRVDIIVSVDNSGSMADERAQLAGFTSTLVQLLNAANLDWRVGVTSVECSNIRADMALPQDFRDIFPAAGGGIFAPPAPCSIPFGGGFGSGGNGRLLGGGFTNDPAQIASRINSASTSASEFTLAMGLAAAVRAQPRSETQIDKLRPDAAVVVILITDEEDELFKELLSFLPSDALNAMQQAQLEATTQPFIAYAQRPELSVPIFGLYGLPGDATCTTSEKTSAIHDIVVKTGGAGGSICQPDITATLETITNAVAGLASGLRLRGSPVSPSIEVSRADLGAGVISPAPRSRLNGFDFDAIVNRIAFYGNAQPVTGDRVIVPYLRWVNSVRMCATELDCPAGQGLKCVSGECR